MKSVHLGERTVHTWEGLGTLSAPTGCSGSAAVCADQDFSDSCQTALTAGLMHSVGPPEICTPCGAAPSAPAPLTLVNEECNLGPPWRRRQRRGGRGHRGADAYSGCPASAGAAGCAARSCGRGAGRRRSTGSRPATARAGAAGPSGSRARPGWGCGSCAGRARSAAGTGSRAPGWRRC